MRTVSATEAKRNFAKLRREAANGEDIVITRRGKPIVRLIGIKEAVAEK